MGNDYGFGRAAEESDDAWARARRMIGHIAFSNGSAMTAAQLDEIARKLLGHVVDTLAVRPEGNQRPR